MNRAEKPSLNLKLYAPPRTTTNAINTIKSILLLCKQIWYVPFFWTLTWFTYWILHATILLNTPPTQLNPINLTGVAISTAIVILATSRLGTTIRRNSFLAAKHAATSIKKAFSNTFHTRVHAKNRDPSKTHFEVISEAQKVQAASLKVHTPPLDHQASKGRGGEPFERAPEKLTLSHLDVDDSVARVGYADQHRVSEGPSMECLTCEKLTSCRYRRSERVEAQALGFQTGKCPFAQKLSTNKIAA